jgi:hypothetical protein
LSSVPVVSVGGGGAGFDAPPPQATSRLAARQASSDGSNNLESIFMQDLDMSTKGR